MLIQTTRFGEVEIDAGRIITFPRGLLGFPRQKQYILIEAGEDSTFWWLQSVDLPELAFVVTDPTLFVPTYRVPVSAEQLEGMGIESLDKAQVLVIVNKRQRQLTGNLQGPLVISVADRLGEQLVLSDRRYTTRVPLAELPTPLAATA